jgi:hypothetical protein
LVEDYSAAQLSVHVVTDGVVYKNEVYKVAKNNKSGRDLFQSVLILVSTRLGTDNLNPKYYDALKVKNIIVLAINIVECISLIQNFCTCWVLGLF